MVYSEIGLERQLGLHRRFSHENKIEIILAENILYLFIYGALQFNLVFAHLVKIEFHISDLRRFRRGINVSLS